MSIAKLKRKASIYLLAIILLILVSLSLAHVHSAKAMSAESINVPDNYSTIQAAVDAAIAGDTICVASGTYYENVVIAKPLTLKGAGSDITIIDGGGRGTGVKITADNVNVSGFTIRNSGHGVHLYKCNGANVSSNKITLNKNNGIYVQSSSGNNIGGNTITSNNLSGLFIQDSSGNTIIDNVIASNAFDGVYLYYSNNNSVSSNTITSHVNLPATSLEGSDNNTINNNTISGNEVGISLYDGSNGNTIMGNTILNSGYIGVELFYSGDNSFYHNNFINNTDQVFSDNSAGMWNNSYPSGGNYWSDYEGNDTYSGPFQNITGNDGIGDAPYNSTEYEKDYYPLMIPYDETNPVADAGPDQLVMEGTTVTFDGSGSTDNLGIVDYAWSFTDNTTIVLTGLNVNYTFENVGNFSVTLNVSDFSGNWGTDGMWVNVTAIEVTRDVAITNITVFPPTVTTGEPIFINVTVANEGDMNETFGVTVYYDSSVVGTKNVPSLSSGSNETLIFNWDTTGVPGGDYTVKAVANIMPGETNITDNTRIYGAVTIEKLVSTISVFASTANMTVGESVTINGSISSIRVEVNVTIYYSLSGGVWSTLTTVTTDVDGHYSYVWTPTIAGTYEVKAGWEGDLTHLSDESDVAVVTVNMANSIVLIDISPVSVTVGSNITISGTISPVQVGVNVTIQYRPSGGTWALFAIVTTDSEGNYSYDWTTTEPSSYEIKASWEGNDNTLAAESDVWTATVKEPATNIYLYEAIAIVVVIAASATLVYIIRIRKPKPVHTKKLDLNLYS